VSYCELTVDLGILPRHDCAPLLLNADRTGEPLLWFGVDVTVTGDGDDNAADWETTTIGTLVSPESGRSRTLTLVLCMLHAADEQQLMFGA
jgi:hypothetical protein